MVGDPIENSKSARKFQKKFRREFFFKIENSRAKFILDLGKENYLMTNFFKDFLFSLNEGLRQVSVRHEAQRFCLLSIERRRRFFGYHRRCFVNVFILQQCKRFSRIAQRLFHVFEQWSCSSIDHVRLGFYFNFHFRPTENEFRFSSDLFY